ncbi:hypothetical protein BraRD5C2_38330 [Bradyrhizobium sp. RD5-C2]|nr:hypothetical protein BraRD5C2_38330 [Bradyrhizobium sp. RD5-C2]
MLESVEGTKGLDASSAEAGNSAGKAKPKRPGNANRGSRTCRGNDGRYLETIFFHP